MPTIWAILREPSWISGIEYTKLKAIQIAKACRARAKVWPGNKACSATLRSHKSWHRYRTWVDLHAQEVTVCIADMLPELCFTLSEIVQLEKCFETTHDLHTERGTENRLSNFHGRHTHLIWYWTTIYQLLLTHHVCVPQRRMLLRGRGVPLYLYTFFFPFVMCYHARWLDLTEVRKQGLSSTF